MKTIIYTCITGDYDALIDINTSHQAICFTDRNLQSTTWQIMKIDFSDKIYRHIKICPHLFLPDHEKNVWLDGNIHPWDIDSLISEKNGFWAMQHPRRNCAYREGMRCIEIGKDSKEIILPQLFKYRKDGYPENNGMISSGILIRDNTKQNQSFGDLWWKEVEAHSVRDQISFNYIAWKNGLKYRCFPFLENANKVSHRQ